MHTTLITILFFFISLLGNAQNFNHFKIEQSEIDTSHIILTPLSNKEPGPTEKVGEFYLTGKDEECVSKFINLSKQFFPNQNIPEKIKKYSFIDVYFDKEKRITGFKFYINRKLLEYIAEEQWLEFIEQAKKIDLDPYIDIPHKDSFDFNAIGINFLRY